MAYKINVRKDTINNSNYKPSHNRIRLRQSDWESLLQQEAEKHRKQVGIDTLAADLKSMGQTVQNIYGGWQTAETMQKTRADVEAMYNRINYYQKYRDMFGGEDLSELQKTYKTALDITS